MLSEKEAKTLALKVFVHMYREDAPLTIDGNGNPMESPGPLLSRFPLVYVNSFFVPYWKGQSPLGYEYRPAAYGEFVEINSEDEIGEAIGVLVGRAIVRMKHECLSFLRDGIPSLGIPAPTQDDGPVGQFVLTKNTANEDASAAPFFMLKKCGNGWEVHFGFCGGPATEPAGELAAA